MLLRHFLWFQRTSAIWCGFASFTSVSVIRASVNRYRVLSERKQEDKASQHPNPCVCGFSEHLCTFYVSQLSLTVAKVHPFCLNTTNIAPSPLLLTEFLPSVCFHWPPWKRITSHLHALHEECVIGLNATAQAFFFFSFPLSSLSPPSSFLRMQCLWFRAEFCIQM